MSQILLGTHFVKMDEPCYSLRETLEPAADSKSLRRMQTVKVIRGDAVAEYRQDLGPASAFDGEEFVIPGGVMDERTGRLYVEHTVGELVDIAEHLRHVAHRPPQRPATDLLAAYRELPDRRRRERRKLSLFSRQTKVQRD